MKVAVVGGGGYLGGLLVRAHAERGDTVHAVARNPAAVPALPGVTAHRADITDSAAIPDTFFAGADVLYHCAAEILHEPLMRAVNVDATRVLLDRARGCVGRWVQLSSLSVYGAPRAGVVDEQSAVNPRSLYGRTKLESDGLVEKRAQGAFSYVLVRPAAVVGPRMRNRSMYALIEAVARGRFCFVGAPGAIGNYIHEENMVDALLLCATRDEARGRTYNVAQNCTLERMAATIQAALGSGRKPLRIPEPAARLAAQVARLAPAFPLTPSRVDALTSRVEYRSAGIERELGYVHRKPVEDALQKLAALWKAGAA